MTELTTKSSIFLIVIVGLVGRVLYIRGDVYLALLDKERLITKELRMQLKNQNEAVLKNRVDVKDYIGKQDKQAINIKERYNIKPTKESIKIKTTEEKVNQGSKQQQEGLKVEKDLRHKNDNNYINNIKEDETKKLEEIKRLLDVFYSRGTT